MCVRMCGEFTLQKDSKKDEAGISVVKFGWFEGVFIRTSVNLLGIGKLC